MLLPSTAKIRYTPDALDSGLVTITYCAWDTTGSGTAGGRANLSLTDATGGTTAFSTATDTASLLVNAAPVLTPAPTPSFVGNHQREYCSNIQPDRFHQQRHGNDEDRRYESPAESLLLPLPATEPGPTHSLTAPNFISIDKTTVNNAAVLLLPKDAKLRYTPDGNNGEATPASITYCAWDESSGTAGGRVNISQPNSTGGSTAFSDRHRYRVAHRNQRQRRSRSSRRPPAPCWESSPRTLRRRYLLRISSNSRVRVRQSSPTWITAP